MLIETRIHNLIKGTRIHNLIKGVLGNGKSIRFWIDRWIGDQPLMTKWPNLFAIESIKSCSVRDRISVVGGSAQWNWCWLCSPVSDLQVAELADSQNVLKDVVVSDEKDRWIWSLDKSGSFSSASLKSWVDKDVGIGALRSVKKCGWVAAKCNLFIWRTILDRIPTRQALRRRNISIDSDVCVLCGESVESVDHLFTGCEISMKFWSRMSSWAKIQNLFAFSFADLTEIQFFTAGRKEEKDIIRGLIYVGCWCIWKARNEKLFSNGKGDSEEIFREARSLGFFLVKK
ncbi:putative reverse transcriptase zinc-binding domain-containing protein [Helianthus annuus]|nr:putative reverse transcriptase zinc-binding domain-containing protein [Helianthus annuus]